jgi:cell division protein FtsB
MSSFGARRRDSRGAARLSEVGTSDFGRSRLPESMQTSAYVGESSVVSVSRRSERRRSGGFALVGEEPAYGDRTWAASGGYGASRFGSYATAGSTLRGVADDWDWQDEGDEDWQDDDLRSARDGRSRRSRVASSPRRTRSIGSALRTVPEAIGGAVLSIFGHVRGLVTIAIAALLVWMLYAPARELYVAHRRLETLQATREALQTENDELRGELESLQTREGIENEARARGYVLPGETKVIVEGLTDEPVDGGERAVTDIELDDTRAWYTRMLDDMFGYDPAA